MKFEDMLTSFEVFFSEKYNKELLDAVQKNKSVVIDFHKLEKFDSKLADELLESPKETFNAIDEAVSNIDVGEKLDKKINVRINNMPEEHIINIKDLRSKHLGKFIGIEGIIKQASEVRPEITAATFECQSCGSRITILQTKTALMKPYLCECGNKRGFELVLRNLIDIQRIIIEESPESLEGGSQPKKIEVFLRDDLVDPKFQKKVIPGNKVLICGIMDDAPIKIDGKSESKRRQIYIDANYLQPIEFEFAEVNINEDDIKEIKKLAKNNKIYGLLIQSIAPSIFGYDEIKEAIALQLFGGIRKKRPDGVITRGDIHVFLVGDPGTSKSQILKYVSDLAPKARYVVGKSASGAGITATVVKDEFVKGWALEAGALVLANKGFCSIDELDKMSPEDRVAMHQVMEQQQVTISKANIQATLNARTTILAAANPKFGRFDPYTSIADQIDLPVTLLNRFDLIFSLRDIPNVEKDTSLVRHILKLHENPEAQEAPISSDLLRKYVAYAKSNINPKLTKVVEKEIERFYVGLRNKYAGGEETPIIPISPRQLEALIRLSEASARIRLSNKITEGDSRRAIKLLTACLQQVSFDIETGRFDIDILESGITSKQRDRIRVVISIVEKLQKESEIGAAPIDDVLAEAEEEGISGAFEIIDKLKREGELFEPKKGHIKKV